jgi:hypothetical protein
VVTIIINRMSSSDILIPTYDDPIRIRVVTVGAISVKFSVDSDVPGWRRESQCARTIICNKIKFKSIHKYKINKR